MSQTPQPPADGANAAMTPAARSHLLRVHASVLLFFAVDGLLLTGYAAAGIVSLQLGWIYAAVGCSGAAAMFAIFWRRGGRVGDLDVLGLAQTVFAGLVMLATLGAAPQVGGMMLMSMMAVLALSAVQLKGRDLLALCLLLATASVVLLAAVGSSAGIPGGSTAEQLLTAVWLAWLMAKVTAHNIAGTQLRNMVNKTNAKLGAAMHELEKVAATDELTALPNRRSILAELTRALAGDDGGQVGVALLDIDRFKTVNDRHGHDVGDRVLRTFGELVGRSLRPHDRIGRYGGEEFLLVLRQVRDAQGLADAGERVRRVVEAHDWTTVAAGLAVTTSVGVTLVQPQEDGAAAIRRADAALYQAKGGGRNRVVRG